VNVADMRRSLIFYTRCAAARWPMKTYRDYWPWRAMWLANSMKPWASGRVLRSWWQRLEVDEARIL